MIKTKTKAVSVHSLVVNSQFGLKLLGVSTLLQSLLSRVTVQVMTQDPDDQGVQRPTKPARITRLKKDLAPLVEQIKDGYEVITDSFHIVIKNSTMKFKLGSKLDLIAILNHPATTAFLIDGAGRYYALAELVKLDERWLNLAVYCQVYLNPTKTQEIMLMEVLNGKRSKLEKNFATSIEAKFYHESLVGIEERHVLSAIAVDLARDRRTPLFGKTRFHDSQHSGIQISSVQQALKAGLKRAHVRVIDTDYDDLHDLCSGSLRAVAAVTDDQIFGENTWADWIPGSGAMLNILLSGMLYASTKMTPMSERELFKYLCAQYGDVFRLFCARPEVKVKKFTKLGGRQNIDTLWEQLKAMIDARAEMI